MTHIAQSGVPLSIYERLVRMIDKQRVAHAYLFVGKKGSHKKKTALFFAQSLFCMNKNDYNPCQQCTECRRIERLNHPDVHWLAPEGQSLKIEQVRQLQKEFGYRGMESNQKLVVIESAETMTVQAANSLLKFIEEPYPGTTVILLTENKTSLLPTILSRCQEITFPPPRPDELAEQLMPQCGEEMARLLSFLTADVEEAVTLYQSNWFADLKKIMIQLTEEVHRKPSKALFLIQDEWMKVVKEKHQTDVGLDMLLFWYKDLLYTKLQMTDKIIYLSHKETIARQALHVSQLYIAHSMEHILEAKRKLHVHVHPQLLLEQLALKLHVRGTNT